MTHRSVGERREQVTDHTAVDGDVLGLGVLPRPCGEEDVGDGQVAQRFAQRLGRAQVGRPPSDTRTLRTGRRERPVTAHPSPESRSISAPPAIPVAPTTRACAESVKTGFPSVEVNERKPCKVERYSSPGSGPAPTTGSSVPGCHGVHVPKNAGWTPRQPHNLGHTPTENGDTPLSAGCHRTHVPKIAGRTPRQPHNLGHAPTAMGHAPQHRMPRHPCPDKCRLSRPHQKVPRIRAAHRHHGSGARSVRSRGGKGTSASGARPERTGGARAASPRGSAAPG